MGTVKIWETTIPELSGDAMRRVYLYLPISHCGERFPVLYMFDGHNVFFDSHATYGKSWGMLEYLKRTQRRMIVVAVECNHEGNSRLEEYAPFSFQTDMFGKIEGRGRVYMDWLVNTLKPYIDQNYPTLTDRENTGICGSSMGGLMALFGAVSYQDVFSKAACLSPSLWIDPDKVKALIRGNEISRETHIYMDYGDVEMADRDENPRILPETEALLRNMGADVNLRIIHGGTHCEASWEMRIPEFVECLDL